MLGSVRHEVQIGRPADEVWRLVGASDRLHDWFPGIVGSSVDGAARVITLGSGIMMPEEILVNDSFQRRFQYRITAPVFVHHRGTIDVIELTDDRCLVVYSTEADPRAMALMVGAASRGALDELKRLMETGAAEGAP